MKDIAITYLAALFNEWYLQGKFNVYKTKKCKCGSLILSGDGFAINAYLPGGNFTMKIELKYWSLFKIKTSPTLKKDYVNKTIEECVELLKDLY